MKYHSKYEEIKTLIENDINVLLTGEAGSGKSTLLKQIAEDLDYRFFAMSMTSQTTVAHLLGFISINGTYIPTQFRDCFENGGLYLLDELDAADVNTILCLNTIENGFVSFPDKIVSKHPDFRLVATANPVNAHSNYTGRRKLDQATLDRFYIIELPYCEKLEISLTSPEHYEIMQAIRENLKWYSVSKLISMRNSIRFYKICSIPSINILTELDNLLDGVDTNIKSEISNIVERLLPEAEKEALKLEQITTYNDLQEYVSTLIKKGVPNE